MPFDSGSGRWPPRMFTWIEGRISLGIDRVGEAIDIETRLAVPQTSLHTRAKLLGETRPGTVAGEVRRSWAQFRSFNLTASLM